MSEEHPVPQRLAKLAKSTGNPFIDALLGMLLGLVTNPQMVTVILAVILTSVKATQSKADAKRIMLAQFQAIGQLNAGDPDFVWPKP